tara:strand:- start:572 stop:1648 length:1077 start_codon:yes stop_codon:yes gene_type:complete
MDLIIPVSGKSSRFPNMRPKWMLTHPSGYPMFLESIAGLDLDKFKRIFLVALREHADKYSFEEGVISAVKKKFGLKISKKFKIVILEEETSSQPETVAMCIKLENITQRFMIKDSDNFFTCEISNNNSIVTHSLEEMEKVNASNKSYVLLDDNGVVQNIVEKKVISSNFCAGAYTFESGEKFLKSYNSIKHKENLYVSHVIYKMILDGDVFNIENAKSYIDWGTLSDWKEFKSSFASIFIDLDGVIVENSGQFLSPSWGETGPLYENMKCVNELYDTGRCEIIITTSRTSDFKKETEKQLDKIGLKYHRVLYDLMHCQRIIVNDFAKTNSFKSCNSINIQRNSESLREKIDYMIKRAK